MKINFKSVMVTHRAGSASLFLHDLAQVQNGLLITCPLQCSSWHALPGCCVRETQLADSFPATAASHCHMRVCPVVMCFEW